MWHLHKEYQIRVRPQDMCPGQMKAAVGRNPWTDSRTNSARSSPWKESETEWFAWCCKAFYIPPFGVCYMLILCSLCCFLFSLPAALSPFSSYLSFPSALLDSSMAIALEPASGFIPCNIFCLQNPSWNSNCSSVWVPGSLVTRSL